MAQIKVRVPNGISSHHGQLMAGDVREVRVRTRVSDRVFPSSMVREVLWRCCIRVPSRVARHSNQKDA